MSTRQESTSAKTADSTETTACHGVPWREVVAKTTSVAPPEDKPLSAQASHCRKVPGELWREQTAHEKTAPFDALKCLPRLPARQREPEGLTTHVLQSALSL